MAASDSNAKSSVDTVGLAPDPKFPNQRLGRDQLSIKVGIGCLFGGRIQFNPGFVWYQSLFVWLFFLGGRNLGT